MIARLARAAALALAAVAAACSSGAMVGLAYSNAALVYGNLGSMLAWTVEEYVELEEAQEAWVRGRIERLHAWHRREELPRYRRLFESMLAHAAQPFDAAVVAGYDREVRAGYARLMEQVIPDMAQFLGDLEPEQARQIERKFAADNRRYAREAQPGTPEERAALRAQRFVHHLEGWIGDLDGAQRRMVDQHYRELPDLAGGFLEERRQRQARILQLARERPGAAAARALLRRQFLEQHTWRQPELAAQLRARDQRAFEFLARLSTTLSTAQRAALQERIRGFLREIDAATAPG